MTFLAMCFIGCNNRTETILMKQVDENEVLLKILDSNLKSSFEEIKDRKPIEYIKMIESWEMKAKAIDSLFVLSETKANGQNQKTILTQLDSTKTKVKSIILGSNFTDERFSNLFAVPLDKLYKNDSSFITEIFNSSLSDKSKKSIITNFFHKRRYDLMYFCFDNSPRIYCGYGNEAESLIVNIDKPIAKIGEKITITAGIGTFSYWKEPQIYIENKKCELGRNLISSYSFVAKNKIGTYKIPVKTIEQNPDGTTRSITKDIEYRIIDINCE